MQVYSVIKMLKSLELEVRYHPQIHINLHRTHDNHLVESIAYSGSEYNKTIIAITNQIGCPVGCDFCYVSKRRFERNITAEEYLQQVEEVVENRNLIPWFDPEKKLKVSFCRAGEPLLNENTTEGILKIAEKYHPQFQFVSIMPNTPVTNSLLEGISEFAKNYDKPFQMMISMHTTDEGKRRDIIPYNSLMNFKEIAEFGEEWVRKTNNRKINLHFALMEDNEVDLENLREIFSPDYFAVRFGFYLPSTRETAEKHKPSLVKRLEQKLEEAKKLEFMAIRSQAKDIEFVWDCRSHCSFKFLRGEYLEDGRKF